MGARGFITGLLAVAAAGLLFLVLHGPEPPDAGIAAEPLTPLRAAEIDRITIEVQDHDPLRLIREARRWWLAGPTRLPVPTPRAERLTELAESVIVRSYEANSRDLADFGLDPARVRLRMNGFELALGSTDPIDGNRYVLTGNRLALVRAAVDDLLMADPADWIDTALLPGAPALAAIELPGLKMTLQTDGRWQINPERPGTTPDNTNAFVDLWRWARAQRVRRGGGAGTPIVLRTGDGDRIALRVLQWKPEMELARPDLGLVYLFDAEQTERLLAGPVAVAEAVPSHD